VLGRRTFSKSAGLRIGYALGPAEVIATFDRARRPFNTSSLVKVGAAAVIEDHECWAAIRDLVADSLTEFYACFERLGLFCVPSQTNFLLARIGPQAAEVADAILRRGVIVRDMTAHSLPDFLRISVRLIEENRLFVAELSDILTGRGWCRC
jgi:histidinol-phosphate aminotransferase